VAAERLDNLNTEQINAQQALDTYCSQHAEEQKDHHKQAMLISSLVDLENKLNKLDNTREYIKVLLIADELRQESVKLDSI